MSSDHNPPDGGDFHRDGLPEEHMPKGGVNAPVPVAPEATPRSTHG